MALDGERWHVEVFDEPARLASFLNQVEVRREQVVDLQFHALSPSAQRIMLTCRLTADQILAREHWLDVERTLHPPAVAVATGSGH